MSLQHFLLLWYGNDPTWNMLRLSMESALLVGIPESHLAFAPCDNLIRERVRRAFPAVRIIDIDLEDQNLPMPDQVHHLFGSHGFVKISYQRYRAMAILLAEPDMRILYVDSDVVFFRNPLSYLLAFCGRYGDHLIMQDDNEASSVDLLSLNAVRSWNGLDRICCTGFMVWSSVDSHHAMLRRMLDEGKQRVMDEAGNGALLQDQARFNAIKAESSIKIRTLPVAYFPNGSALKSQSGGSVSDVAFILHANYMVGKENKEKIMWAYMPLSDLTPKLNLLNIAKDPEYNIAYQKPCAVSSAFSVKDHKIDITNGNIMQGSGFHSKNEEFPWCFVDLLSVCKIKYIIIVYHISYLEEAAGLHISISSECTKWSVVYERRPGDRLDIVMIVPVAAAARFVRCALPREGVLHLCQIVVVPENAPDFVIPRRLLSLPPSTPAD